MAGKSLLVFDTAFTGVRSRCSRSFSVYARRIVEQLEKPDTDFLARISSTIGTDGRYIAEGTPTQVVRPALCTGGFPRPLLGAA